MFEDREWGKYSVRLDGKVAVVELDNTENDNNFSLQVMEELYEIFGELEHDDRVRCVLVTHAGEHFSKGGCADR